MNQLNGVKQVIAPRSIQIRYWSSGVRYAYNLCIGTAVRDRSLPPAEIDSSLAHPVRLHLHRRRNQSRSHRTQCHRNSHQQLGQHHRHQGNRSLRLHHFRRHHHQCRYLHHQAGSNGPARPCQPRLDLHRVSGLRGVHRGYRDVCSHCGKECDGLYPKHGVWSSGLHRNQRGFNRRRWIFRGHPHSCAYGQLCLESVTNQTVCVSFTGRVRDHRNDDYLYTSNRQRIEPRRCHECPDQYGRYHYDSSGCLSIHANAGPKQQYIGSGFCPRESPLPAAAAGN